MKNIGTSRAVTKDGVRFSGMPNNLMRMAKIIKDKHGDDVLNDFGNNEWDGLIDIWASCGHNYQTSVAFAYSVFLFNKKDWQSIYVADDHLTNFLSSYSVKDSDFRLFYQVIDNLMPNFDGSRSFAIHLPDIKHSLFVFYVPSSDDDAGYLCYVKHDYMGFCTIKPDGNNMDIIKQWGEYAEDWKVIFGLFIYMDAFPDCVRAGPPEVVKGYVEKTNSLTLLTHDVIKRENEMSKVIPHMRRGHFRVLQSERYTKKRFQAVYVKPSMIGGESLTVTSEGV